MNNDEVFTVDDLCKYLKMSKRTVLPKLQSGEINGKKSGGIWRILKSEVDKYLRNESNK